MTRTGRLLLPLPLILVIVAGCRHNPTPANVSGTITYRGQPVTAGSVAFYPEEGGMFSYSIGNDGSYSGWGLPAGELVVTVETESINPNPKGRPKATYGGKDKKRKGGNPNEYMEKMKAMGKAPDVSATTTGAYVRIPAKYAEKNKSPLRATLEKGTNVVNFELTD
jgi:hypothetical protein